MLQEGFFKHWWVLPSLYEGKERNSTNMASAHRSSQNVRAPAVSRREPQN